MRQHYLVVPGKSFKDRLTFSSAPECRDSVEQLERSENLFVMAATNARVQFS